MNAINATGALNVTGGQDGWKHFKNRQSCRLHDRGHHKDHQTHSASEVISFNVSGEYFHISR